ncbi:unnamed protein product, partial [Callosobruchus maculatus]
MVMERPNTTYEGNFDGFLMSTDASIDYVSRLNVCEL